MPHIDVKHFPRDLSEEEKKVIAEDLAAVLKKHFGSSNDSLSVAFNEVQPERWKDDVYDPIIKPHLDTLAKKPGYSY
ncbi:MULTISPECIES: tautomerase PptA [Pectobacterium]|uniref:Tautomerase PptA n=1 Tax=Pectobacterium punjabense TaxID=2108399 RepID=A0ABX6L3W2_9GAMM|nr:MULTISPECIES: tautomerase PptA [Pectobacterium]GKW12658.1 tautomerase PptA [Pectobacterium carotovorum subsp. carotovorum]MBN3137374.1 tautomerase PptA [Pectobacterium punjabense]MBS4432050.1 tautomerase PptA [Pectobacterium punjabense]MBT9183317.1 tautomerase PptA [Pectobacterium punjabense]MCE5380387.1 tautomerase PptA [Pectobacterium punjabense]